MRYEGLDNAAKVVGEMVERFARNVEAYRRAGYGRTDAGALR